MLAQLRQSTKVILWIVIIAFVGLIFVVWGMNLSRSGGLEAGIAGRVNGERVTTEEYRNAVTNERAAYYQDKGRRSSTQAEEEINQKAWDSLVQNRILWNQVALERLTATDEEVFLELQANPPAFVRAQPVFQTDSVFDPEKYLQALQDPQYDFRPLEQYIRATLPIQKLQEYMVSAVRVTEDETNLLLSMLEEKAAISYVKVSAATDVRDVPADASDSDVSAYYASHSEEFKVADKRKFRYVKFDKAPSAEDESYASARIQEALDLVNEGESFEEMAAEYSDDENTGPRGGDLGWRRRGQLSGALDSAAFSLAPGQVSGIVRTPNALHVLKVDERRTTDGIEEVRVRHILAKLEASPSTIEQLRVESAEFAEMARDKDIDRAASEQGLSPSDSPELTLEQVTGFWRLTKAETEALFAAERRQITGPMEGGQAFYVFQTAEVVPSHVPPLDEIKDRAKQTYLMSLRRDKARQIAEAVAAEVARGKTLEAAAAAWNLAVARTDPFSRTSNVPGIGQDNPVVAHAFVLGYGQSSKAIQNGNDCFVIRVDLKQPPDLAALGQDPRQIKMSLLSTKQQAFLNDWYVGLLAEAKIEDYRSAASAGRAASSQFLYTGY
ncbi:MAG: peptidyl-prolyl cis-trans isomerase [bacterium]